MALYHTAGKQKIVTTRPPKYRGFETADGNVVQDRFQVEFAWLAGMAISSLIHVKMPVVWEAHQTPEEHETPFEVLRMWRPWML